MFMDADILVKPDFLKLAIKELQTRKIDVSGCYIIPMTKIFADRFYHSIFISGLFLINYEYSKIPGIFFFSTKKNWPYFFLLLPLVN